MNHSPETCERIGTFRDGRPIWRCPECGVKLVGERPVGECGSKTNPPDTSCAYRREPTGVQVPCGLCGGKTKLATVYLCIIAGGRACTLQAVGTGDEQRVHGVLPVACVTCADRKSLTPPSA